MASWSVLPGTSVRLLGQLEPLLVPVEDVRPDPRNPRVERDLGVLVEDIRRFGYRVPILVNQTTGCIEAGHQRLKAVVQLGGTHIPVLYVAESATEASGFMVADNRSSDLVADWDEELLCGILKDLAADADCGGLEGVGYDDADLAALIGKWSPDNEQPFVQDGGAEPSNRRSPVAPKRASMVSVGSFVYWIERVEFPHDQVNDLTTAFQEKATDDEKQELSSKVCRLVTEEITRWRG